jgi:hypothetical protein
VAGIKSPTVLRYTPVAQNSSASRISGFRPNEDPVEVIFEQVLACLLSLSTRNSSDIIFMVGIKFHIMH